MYYDLVSMASAYREVGSRIGAAGRIDKVKPGDVHSSVTKVAQVELVNLLDETQQNKNVISSPVAFG